MTKKLPIHIKHKRLVYLISALTVGIIDLSMVLGVLVFNFSNGHEEDERQVAESQVLGNHSTYKFEDLPSKYEFNPWTGILNLALGPSNFRTFESMVPKKITFPKDKFINRLKLRPTPSMTPTSTPTPSLTPNSISTITLLTTTPSKVLSTATSTPAAIATPSNGQTEQPTSTPTTTMATPTPTRTPTPSPTKTPTPIPTPTTSSGGQSGTNQSVFVTFYGWNDNTPPGPDIAYSKLWTSNTVHEKAGGIGTYDDPITFAALTNAYPVGTRIYVPYVKKYAILEDICGGCTDKNGYRHIDLWMESNGNFGDQLRECQYNWTRMQEPVTIELNPPAGREVNTTPFFNSSSGSCQQSM